MVASNSVFASSSLCPVAGESDSVDIVCRDGIESEEVSLEVASSR